MSMSVTDFKWIDSRYNKMRVGYYMDEYLAINLMGIPEYLKRSYDVVGIFSGHGKVRVGKAQPKGSKVLMSNGEWKNIEYINIGDEVISPSIDGKSSTFAKVIDKQHHFDREMCIVKNKHDNTILYTCCIDHNIPTKTLWLKKEKGKINYNWKYEVYAAEELSSKDKQWYKNHCPKTITSPIIENFSVGNLNVDPYLLGLYIGDGYYKGTKIAITNPEEKIHEWLKNNTKYIRKTYSKNGNGNLCSMSIFEDEYNFKMLCGLGSYNKKIPIEALKSNYKYRKRLFEGLLDTDGYINKKGFVIYTTASEQLAKDVAMLAKTLGCQARIKNSFKKCQTFKEKKKYYNVNINIGELSLHLNLLRDLRMNRLKSLDLSNTQNRECQFESIEVEKIKDKLEAYCIQVDSESHLYITDNMCVTHNSTLAQQVGYFLAWLISGGSMAREEATGKWFIATKPTKSIRFTIEDNVVFTPDDLQSKARELYSKYGRNQVIVYDEGRAGLDSAAAMSAINKAMQDFFQECGQYGHVILIVLPNFFKLHEDYAISRSIFLIDVFTNKRMERGFFNFYNEGQKEALYINGKKKSGTQSKYTGARPSFTGRFSPFLPLDKEIYEKAKQDAIKQKEVKNIEKKWKRQRDATFLALYKEVGMSPEAIALLISNLSGTPLDANMVKFGIRSITGKPLGDIK